ncbi:unnamed protein product [Zymoseptoria tritici ST99CH_1A5]|uniref:Uncharacterized protein n=3 Tax=Zymoseptoria tritici TaxID=1047171 RepID=A0A1X7S7C1_ZYMT9|nr:unnamed protein product [Zymoseptoria tritici ST99CH_3D7]SMR60795.1 unnamed protein product [Zymoseptoria tritici ST99CH_1E4]SMY29284.1 unnamed protein product [Zymoseptoria tritici ST99CH_1A5]
MQLTTYLLIATSIVGAFGSPANSPPKNPSTNPDPNKKHNMYCDGGQALATAYSCADAHGGPIYDSDHCCVYEKYLADFNKGCAHRGGSGKEDPKGC